MTNFIPVTPPIGIYKNGTAYSAKGRWADANFVRFKDGSARPMGGYTRLNGSSGAPLPSFVADFFTETIRDMLTWRDNSGQLYSLLCSNSAVYSLGVDSVVVTVTPTGFSGSINQPLGDTGYGMGLFGAGPYGTARAGAGNTTKAVIRWFLDTWGENVLLTSTESGEIYEYSPAAAEALVVANAPTDSTGVVVTDQRFVMSIDGTRKVSWSDKEDNTSWTPAVDNEAGDQTMTGVGDFKCILRVGPEVLVISETDAIRVRYIGPPYVYSLESVKDGCGIIGAKAGIATDEFAIWAGNGTFWRYDNGVVSQVPCDVMDFFIHDKNHSMDSKIVTYNNPEFSEVWWLYQAKDTYAGTLDGVGPEVDSYILYNYATQHWNVGKLERTAGYESGAAPSPRMVDIRGRVWQHEQRGVLVPNTFLESGPLELGNGDMNMAVRAVMPDTAFANDVSFTLMGKSAPNEVEYSYGPYPYNSPQPTRAEGREVRIRIEGETVDWEVGTFRMDVAPTGGGSR